MAYDDDEVRLWIQSVGLLRASEVSERDAEAVQDAVAPLLTHAGLRDLPPEIRHMVGEALEAGYARAITELRGERPAGAATDRHP